MLGLTTCTNFNKVVRLANMLMVHLAPMCKVHPARMRKVRLNGRHSHTMSRSPLSSGDHHLCLK
jgi:hypothetical protein